MSKEEVDGLEGSKDLKPISENSEINITDEIKLVNEFINIESSKSSAKKVEGENEIDNAEFDKVIGNASAEIDRLKIVQKNKLLNYQITQ